MTYSEQLKHPKWQKKRLEVLSRAKFQCEHCGEPDKTLHVHHGRYLKGKKPWEYPPEMLHCLCEDCHKLAEEASDDCLSVIGRMDLSELRVLSNLLDSISRQSFKGLNDATESFCCLLSVPSDPFLGVLPLLWRVIEQNKQLKKLHDDLKLQAEKDSDPISELF